MFLLLAVAMAAAPASPETYEAERWVRSPFAVVATGVQLTTTYDPQLAPVPWGVFDGMGRLLTAEEFVDGAHDVGMGKRFERERKKAQATTTVLTVVAILASTGGLSAGGAPDYPTPDPAAGAPQGTAAWNELIGRRAVSDYYTAELADELIVSHNNGVRRRAGLSTEATAAIDKQPPGQRQPAP